MHQLIIAAAVAAAPICQGGDEYQARSLAVGDPAPALQIGHWLKGAEVESFEEGKIYVVEFWATWCGPCRASIPHLGELQQQLKDYGVTVIGVSDEPLQTVVEFLSKPAAAGADENEQPKLWTERMAYTVAADPDRSTHGDYMTAAGMRGIPAAFLVGKDGRIEWIGRPNVPVGEIDRVIDAVVHDTWDRGAFATLHDLRKQAERASADGNAEQVVALGRQLLELDPAGAPLYQDVLFWTLLTKVDRADEAYELAKGLLKQHWESAGYLNGFAWRIATDESVPRRDLDLALKAALRANDLTGSEDAAILDTVARVYYEKGDLRSAVKWQRRAVKHAPETGKMTEELEAALEKYEQESR